MLLAALSEAGTVEFGNAVVAAGKVAGEEFCGAHGRHGARQYRGRSAARREASDIFCELPRSQGVVMITLRS